MQGTTESLNQRPSDKAGLASDTLPAPSGNGWSSPRIATVSCYGYIWYPWLLVIVPAAMEAPIQLIKRFGAPIGTMKIAQSVCALILLGGIVDLSLVEVSENQWRQVGVAQWTDYRSSYNHNLITSLEKYKYEINQEPVIAVEGADNIFTPWLYRSLHYLEQEGFHNKWIVYIAPQFEQYYRSYLDGQVRDPTTTYVRRGQSAPASGMLVLYADENGNPKHADVVTVSVGLVTHYGVIAIEHAIQNSR